MMVNPCEEILPRKTDCTSCTADDVENVERLELSYCMGCGVMPTYIPAEQVRDYIRKKYYGNIGD